MSTVEQKYKRRLLTSLRHVLPEYEADVKRCTLTFKSKSSNQGSTSHSVTKETKSELESDDSDVGSMKYLLEHDNHGNRRRIEELISQNDVFKPYYNLSLDEQREQELLQERPRRCCR